MTNASYGNLLHGLINKFCQDPITGATGELDRNKCIKTNFITPVPADVEPETIAERKVNIMKYDAFECTIVHSNRT